MIFRSCDSAVRVVELAKSQRALIEQWESEILHRRVDMSFYLELVAAHSCDTIYVSPARYSKVDPPLPFIDILFSGDVKIDKPYPWWDSYKTRYAISRNALGGQLTLTEFEVMSVRAQRHGIGAHVFATQALAAHRLGFGTISAFADGRHGKNGYYTWPRLGFDKTLSETERAALPRELSDAVLLSNLLQSAPGRDWWRAHGAEIGGGVDVDFDTSPISRSMRTLRAYFVSKGWKWPKGRYVVPSTRGVATLRQSRDEPPCTCI